MGYITKNSIPQIQGVESAELGIALTYSAKIIGEFCGTFPFVFRARNLVVLQFYGCSEDGYGKTTCSLFEGFKKGYFYFKVLDHRI